MREMLENQINEFITDETIKKVVNLAFKNVAKDFFVEAASSSGKYHPSFALGEGGLVRHTYAATWIATQIVGLEMYNLSDKDQQLVVAATILHDTCKRGVDFSSPNTCHEHPLLVRNLISTDELTAEEKDIWNVINILIASHMGQWTTSNYSETILPKPNEAILVEKFPNIIVMREIVHLSDYIASRKGWTMESFINTASN